MPRTQTPPPAHLMPLSLLFLLWHSVLAADYVIAQFQIGTSGWPALMAAMPLDTLWLKVVWALGVWVGFAAAFFLVLRDNASVMMFFVSALGWVGVAVGTYASPAPALGLPLIPLLSVLVLVPVLGWIYARSLNRQGALH